MKKKQDGYCHTLCRANKIRLPNQLVGSGFMAFSFTRPRAELVLLRHCLILPDYWADREQATRARHSIALLVWSNYTQEGGKPEGSATTWENSSRGPGRAEQSRTEPEHYWSARGGTNLAAYRQHHGNSSTYRMYCYYSDASLLLCQSGGWAAARAAAAAAVEQQWLRRL
jgi:hypothetical protein